METDYIEHVRQLLPRYIKCVKKIHTTSNQQKHIINKLSEIQITEKNKNWVKSAIFYPNGKVIYDYITRNTKIIHRAQIVILEFKY